MNELNLQNPEFLKRVDRLFYTKNCLTAIFRVFGLHIVFNETLTSHEKPLENHQQWFTKNGRKIKTLQELDNIRYRRELKLN